MNEIVKAPDNEFMIRCPRLGHQIYFSYCRQENQGLPCFKVLDCWHTYFDVVQFFKNRLSSDQWQALCEQRIPKPKTVSLLELIEKAQASKAKDTDQSP
jgi:hypothetical protein